jgi:hypothetical protein
MRADFDQQSFQEREARRGDEIARRAARMPRPRKADPSVAPSTGPTFVRTVARAMNCPGPAPDTRRPVSAAGATTSHLKVTSVRHAGAAREPDGSGSSQHRASQHQLYIERAVAVERSPTVVQSDAEPEQQQARRQQAYMERSAAVERVEEIIASFGNLGRTPEERAAFWAAVEESGHPARSYVVATCRRNRSPAFWKAVSDDPTAPGCLKALDGPGPHKLKFKTEAEAAPVIAFADSHGETSAKAKAERAIVLSPGRASRIQTRIILELPHELTAAQRLELAKRICRELFGGGQIRFWAAIHAPNAHNDERNFHLHIVFWDRPARKVTDKFGARKWDFEIVERFVDQKNHNARWWRPHLQRRDRTFSARSWIKQARERVAALANDALAEAGVERRVDPRRYSEMGVDLEPEPRAPAKAYALEKRGVETAAARPAIEAQWRRARQRLSQQYDDFQPDAEIEARFDGAFQRASDLIDTTLRLDALIAGEQWRAAVLHIHAAEADVAALRFNMAKIRSRLAPPIETGDRRARETSLAQLATIEAEFLAEIGQQAAVAAAVEARALETLAILERALAVSAPRIRLGGEIERPTAQPAAAPGVALAAHALALSAASAAADSEFASAPIALTRQRQEAVVESELPPVDPAHIAAKTTLLNFADRADSVARLEADRALTLTDELAADAAAALALQCACASASLRLALNAAANRRRPVAHAADQAIDAEAAPHAVDRDAPQPDIATMTTPLDYADRGDAIARLEADRALTLTDELAADAAAALALQCACASASLRLELSVAANQGRLLAHAADLVADAETAPSVVDRDAPTPASDIAAETTPLDYADRAASIAPLVADRALTLTDELAADAAAALALQCACTSASLKLTLDAAANRRSLVAHVADQAVDAEAAPYAVDHDAPLPDIAAKATLPNYAIRADSVALLEADRALTFTDQLAADAAAALALQCACASAYVTLAFNAATNWQRRVAHAADLVANAEPAPSAVDRDASTPAPDIAAEATPLDYIGRANTVAALQADHATTLVDELASDAARALALQCACASTSVTLALDAAANRQRRIAQAAEPAEAINGAQAQGAIQIESTRVGATIPVVLTPRKEESDDRRNQPDAAERFRRQESGIADNDRSIAGSNRVDAQAAIVLPGGAGAPAKTTEGLPVDATARRDMGVTPSDLGSPQSSLELDRGRADGYCAAPLK